MAIDGKRLITRNEVEVRVTKLMMNISANVVVMLGDQWDLIDDSSKILSPNEFTEALVYAVEGALRGGYMEYNSL